MKKLRNVRTGEIISMEQFTSKQVEAFREWWENSMELQMEFPTPEIFISEMQKQNIVDGYEEV